jgi:membrane protease subunit (stomatin/prohibitin family)
VEQAYTRDKIDEQMKADFVSALQPAFGELAEQELRPAQIPAKTNVLKAAMNAQLKLDWGDRGISIEKISLNPITLNPEDMKKIQTFEDTEAYGSNAFLQSGLAALSAAEAMKTAAGNSAGAMTGFMGMGMASNMGGGGFNAAQQLYNTGMQQQQMQAQMQQTAAAASEDKWTCECGASNTGKFCQNCGGKKPAGIPQYKCDKCGWQPADPTKAPKFCPECGDIFDNGDIV